MEKKHIYDYIEILVRKQPTQFLSTILQKLIEDVKIRLSERQINRESTYLLIIVGTIGQWTNCGIKLTG